MRNSYALYNLYHQEFEDLVILICQKVLGIGAKGFSDGPDGGRDAKFIGKAQEYPSTESLWEGVFIIQAKHTQKINATCSNPKFSSFTNKGSTLSKEIARLKKLKQKENFDNYLLFTNRTLSANEDAKIIKKFQEEIGIKNMAILGEENITKYLTKHSDIFETLLYTKVNVPIFYEKDIKEIIDVFISQQQTVVSKNTLDSQEFVNVPKEKKNKLNNLSAEYFSFIQQHSQSYFNKIDTFLKMPKNGTYQKYYKSIVSDLGAKIALERTDFIRFEDLLERLINTIIRNNFDDLRTKRNLVRIFLHFMYFNCDIGKKS